MHEKLLSEEFSSGISSENEMNELNQETARSESSLDFDFPEYSVISCYADKQLEDITRPEKLGCGYKPDSCLWFSFYDAYHRHLSQVLGDKTIFNELYSLTLEKNIFTNDHLNKDSSKILTISLIKEYINFYKRFWRSDYEGLDWDMIAKYFSGVCFCEKIPEKYNLSLPYGIYGDFYKRGSIGGYIWDRRVIMEMEYIRQVD